ncbi:hypothetical protein [Halorhabdus rudnickae]|uniref:hypothetical protein n=1 Tax=Halorhabdus rudnickae TaxID=1775544 RepID=UPI00108444AF|nr:hypothetical protein [Halorhabdus rudnickae]
MARTVEITGRLIVLSLYAVTILGFLVFVGAILYPFDGPANLGLAVLFVGVAVAMVVHLWRIKTGRDTVEFPPPGNVHHRPLSPGWMAKERWLKAVNQLPENDDDDKA